MLINHAWDPYRSHVRAYQRLKMETRGSLRRNERQKATATWWKQGHSLMNLRIWWCIMHALVRNKTMTRAVVSLSHSLSLARGCIHSSRSQRIDRLHAHFGLSPFRPWHVPLPPSNQTHLHLSLSLHRTTQTTIFILFFSFFFLFFTLHLPPS